MEREREKIRRTQIIDPSEVGHDQLQKDHGELHHRHQVSKHFSVFQKCFKLLFVLKGLLQDITQ